MTGSSVISQPLTTLNIVPAAASVSNTAQRVLIVGQMLTGGAATAGALVEQLLNDNSESTLFGTRSQLAAAIRAFKRINKVTRVDAIGLADAGGATTATATVVFTGAATALGTISVSIGSARNSTYQVSSIVGQSAAQAATALAALISADLTNTVTAAAVSGTVTVTASNGGTIGNNYSLRVNSTTPGLSTAVTGFTGGGTDPTATGIFDVIGDNRYQTIVWPHEYGLDIPKDLLDGRFNADNAVLDGVVITSTSDTFANLRTEITSQNSQSVVVLGFNELDEATYRGSSMLEPALDVAANAAAIRSLRLTDGVSIARYVIAGNGPRDTFGGPAIASLPYFNTPFPFLPMIPTGRGFDATELEDLKTAGVSSIGNNRAGNTTIADEFVTTYKTDSAGNPDVSFRFLNYVDTASNVREYMSNNIRARFAQSRLTEGDVVEGRSMANAQTIQAYLTGLYNTLSGPDFALTQAGEAALQFFIDNTTIQIDLATGRATVNMQVPMVTQLREFIGTVQIAFGTEG